uniref:LanC-like protein 3 homolog n=2 Tax=Cacopsylla melanoneura TaxID=428564 RepID=A0A8D8S7I7_9HEMI
MNSERYFTNQLDLSRGGSWLDNFNFWKQEADKIIESVLINVDASADITKQKIDHTLYTGNLGVGYMLWYVAQSPLYASEASTYYLKARRYLDSLKNVLATKKHRCITDYSAFVCGDAGIHAILGVFYSTVGDKERSQCHFEMYTKLAFHIKAVDYVKFGGDEYLVGRAGYLAGIQWAEKQLGKQVLCLEDRVSICNAIVVSGRSYSQTNNLRCPLMYQYYGTEYLGAAHGLSSILQVLLCEKNYVKSNPDVEKDIKESIDFLLKIQMPNGNFPADLKELYSPTTVANELVHWCHGAPGVIYLMAKAYLFWGEEKYLNSCIKCGDVIWEKGLLKKGPGICHGVAGNGYAFLLLYRLTKNEQYLHKAYLFANFMLSDDFKRNSRMPDAPFSLYEGLAGTACFFVDLLQPDKAIFPFMDIF